jgi:hypothetical protein
MHEWRRFQAAPILRELDAAGVEAIKRLTTG